MWCATAFPELSIDLCQCIKVMQQGNDNDSIPNAVTWRLERLEMPNASTLSKRVTIAQCVWSHLTAHQSNVQLPALTRTQHWKTFTGLKCPEAACPVDWDKPMVFVSLVFCMHPLH